MIPLIPSTKELIDRIRNFVVACQNGDSKVKAIKMLDYLDEVH